MWAQARSMDSVGFALPAPPPVCSQLPEVRLAGEMLPAECLQGDSDHFQSREPPSPVTGKIGEVMTLSAHESPGS